MSMMEQMLQGKEMLDRDGVPTDEQFCQLTPSQLYQLCGELQQHMLINSAEYTDINNCKAALACKNWDVARVAMPSTLYGVRIDLIA